MSVLQVCCYLFIFYLSSSLTGLIFSQYWDCERMFWICDYKCEPWNGTKYVGICCRRGSVTITSGYVLKAYQSIQSLSSWHSYFRLYVENFVYFFLNTFSVIFLFHLEDSCCSREEVFFLKQCLLQFAYLPFI